MVSHTFVVEVACALAERQTLLRLEVSPGTTLSQAVEQSGIAAYMPELDLPSCPMGIHGKRIARPEVHVLSVGDRVEIYRPLVADPKDVRRLRAARAKARATAGGAD